MIQSPDGPILLFSLCPFSPFPFLSCPSAPWLLPPRPPSRGRPPPPSDCTPWPLGRRGRSSCRGTLRSSAPLSTAGSQERSSGLGAWELTIDDCRLMIASRDPRLSPVTCPLFPAWLLTPASPPAHRAPSPQSRDPHLSPLTCPLFPAGLLPSAFGLLPSASPPSPPSGPPGIWPIAADRWHCQAPGPAAGR